MNYQEQGFRAFKNKLVIIQTNSELKEKLQDYPNYQDIQSILLYGYVDHNYGFSLETIALSKDNDSFYEEEDVPSLVLEADELADYDLEILENYDLQIHYNAKISKIRESEGSVGLQWTREFVYLDPFRDFKHPDIVTAYLKTSSGEVEAVRVQITGMKGSDIITKLVQEPSQKFALKVEDEIIFTVQKQEDGRRILVKEI